MVLSIIVAAAENNAIGSNNALLWRLSADLKRFKALTTGNTVIMGRNTFESIGKALPNRRNIVVSRNAAYCAEGCEVVNSIDRALETAGEENEVFIIGGGMIYGAAWSKAERLYLTQVHTSLHGDTFIPPIDLSEWKELSREDFQADEKNEYAYSFINYKRKY